MWGVMHRDAADDILSLLGDGAAGVKGCIRGHDPALAWEEGACKGRRGVGRGLPEPNTSAKEAHKSRRCGWVMVVMNREQRVHRPGGIQ